MKHALIAALSEADYLQGEKIVQVKHEYVAGEVFAMVGASQAHGILAGNIVAALRNHLRGRPCRTFIAVPSPRSRGEGQGEGIELSSRLRPIVSPSAAHVLRPVRQHTRRPRPRLPGGVRRAAARHCPLWLRRTRHHAARLRHRSDDRRRAVAARRFARANEFEAVEGSLDPVFKEARAAGVHTFLSAIIKTPDELRQGSFVHLDMTDQARILFDPTNLLRDYLEDLARRLKAMGAHRVQKGGGYYWVLKPDYKPGDRIEL